MPCASKSFAELISWRSVTGNIYLASLFTLLAEALCWKNANSWGALASIVLGAIGLIAFLAINAVVPDPARQISPETAGLSAFAMVFGGMLPGSLAGRMAGVGSTARQTEVDGGDSFLHGSGCA